MVELCASCGEKNGVHADFCTNADMRKVYTRADLDTAVAKAVEAGRTDMRNAAAAKIRTMKDAGLMRGSVGCVPVVPPTKCLAAKHFRDGQEDAWRCAALIVERMTDGVPRG